MCLYIVYIIRVVVACAYDMHDILYCIVIGFGVYACVCVCVCLGGGGGVCGLQAYVLGVLRFLTIAC